MHNFELQKEFAVTEVSLSVESLVGIKCSWIRYMEELTLNCSGQNRNLTNGSVSSSKSWLGVTGEYKLLNWRSIKQSLEASMYISVSLLYRLETRMNRLVVTGFNDSRLFSDRSSNIESFFVMGANLGELSENSNFFSFFFRGVSSLRIVFWQLDRKWSSSKSRLW